MNKQYVFSLFGDTEENILEVRKRPVPPPSRPFHVVIGPGQAREGLPKHTKQGPNSPKVQYPLKPHRQTPEPIPTSQTYL
ncbi:hypothetical protein BD769DRAFT_1663185 [Suillus cothurnatus]|nr:hypothetical protein BD769DRAFT_1663185 [Suillus cothurnatus]